MSIFSRGDRIFLYFSAINTFCAAKSLRQILIPLRATKAFFCSPCMLAFWLISRSRLVLAARVTIRMLQRKSAHSIRTNTTQR